MSKTVGIDLGTNSLGLVVNENGRIIYQAVHQFTSGVDKGEYSLAAKRTEFRSKRKLYKVRRYRKWATLKLLIEHGCCPLTMEELDSWRHYDKTKGVRRYPTHFPLFEKWKRCVFDDSDTPDPDFSTPYKIRHWLATTADIDFSVSENKMKLGRAIYHIAERRGFKSIKGVTFGDTENSCEEFTPEENLEETVNILQESERKIGQKLDELICEDFPTVGSVLNHLIEDENKRVRANYQPIRQQYIDEIKYIFDHQSQLQSESAKLLRDKLLSETKKDGTIFYSKPIQSQKGNVGKCAFEPSKPRCPQRRPEYEEFTAWSFINNIRYGEGCCNELSIEQKRTLYNECFIRKTDFEFSSIRKWIEKQMGERFEYSNERSERTINYPDNTKVEACTVICCLRILLGEDWRKWNFSTNKTHRSYQAGRHVTTYTWEDVWHICFSSKDEKPLSLFAEKAQLDLDKLKSLYNKMPIGYGNLSLKAINNINRFLQKGMIYSDACLFAKIPDILGTEWNDCLIEEIKAVIDRTDEEKTVVKIANALIEEWKKEGNRWHMHDLTHRLDDYDMEDVKRSTQDVIGKVTWNKFSDDKQREIFSKVANLYQQFFSNRKHEYFKQLTVGGQIKEFLVKRFPNIEPKKIEKLYHHSAISIYKPATEKRIEQEDASIYKRLLGNPAVPSLRNPMALRVLYTLRRDINELLTNDIIDDTDTRIVVEVARELNDANMRKAIKMYDDKRAKENECFKKMIEKLGFKATKDAILKARLLSEQNEELIGIMAATETNIFFSNKLGETLEKELKRWWKRGAIGRCIYTGNIFTLGDVLNGNGVDKEHTLPRSLSFDDSESNLTICDSQFNRETKKKRLPTELDDFSQILVNIQPWEKLIERLKERISYWRYKAKRAQDKTQKDYAIVQRHACEMELKYWRHKVDNFKAVEISRGFRNSQLVDTSIISKYAALYLKSLFKRVDVQKGTVTAAFRNILNLPEKSRDDNSHHAVDALVLTCIPVAAERDELLRTYYEILEAPKGSDREKELSRQLYDLKHLYGLDVDLLPTIENIRNNVIARYTNHTQTLTHAVRKKKVNGKELIQTGNCIRGQLFYETFYGKIILDGELKTVVRRDVYSANFKEADIAKIVDKTVRETIQKQSKEKGFNNAKREGFYMIGKNGEKKTRIRHVRCEFRKAVLGVKRNDYLSTKEYKQQTYSENGLVPAYALYTDGINYDYRFKRLIEIAKLKKEHDIKNMADIFPESIVYRNKNKEYILPLSFVLTSGKMVILKKKGECLADLSQTDISKRLYRYRSLNKVEEGSIKLQHHLFSDGAATEFTKTYKIGEATPRIIVAKSKQDFWVEGIDFVIEKGTVLIK